MAAPSYATDLTNIIEDMASTTGWTLISSGGGGANSLTAPETDDFIQGSNCISRNPWTTANIRGMVYNSSQTIASNDAVYIWWKADVAQALSTFASGGIQCLIGSSSTDLDAFYVAGSDTYALGGWRCSPIDPTATPSTTLGTPTGTSYFGVRWGIAVSGPSKGFPYKIDAIRHGRQIEITAGDSGTPATWSALATHSSNTTRRWGIVQETDTGASVQGIVYWGTAGASCYSRDSNQTIVLTDTLGFVSTSFTQIQISHASTDLEWDAITFLKLGTTNRGTFTINNNAKAWITNCTLVDMDTTTDGGSNTKFDGSTWRGCNAITAAGGTFLGCSVLTPTVAADASGFIWNIATDPDGYMDGMTFSKGTNAHHAVEFGLTSPLSITLRDCAFGTVFNASNAQNDSTFYIARTTGTVNISLVGCSGNFSYKTAGATVNLIIDPVTTSVTVTDETDSLLSGATVYLRALNGTSDLPFQESVTITRVSSTATVSHTAHGFTTNQYVTIQGADQDEYNGVKQLTLIDANSYSFAVTGTPTTPATGTILATGVVLYGVTTGSGVISDSRTFNNPQPVTGYVRKSSGSPYYIQGSLNGTISNTTGLTINIKMVRDE